MHGQPDCSADLQFRTGGTVPIEEMLIGIYPNMEWVHSFDLGGSGDRHFRAKSWWSKLSGSHGQGSQNIDIIPKTFESRSRSQSIWQELALANILWPQSALYLLRKRKKAQGQAPFYMDFGCFWCIECIVVFAYNASTVDIVNVCWLLHCACGQSRALTFFAR